MPQLFFPIRHQASLNWKKGRQSIPLFYSQAFTSRLPAHIKALIRKQIRSVCGYYLILSSGSSQDDHNGHTDAPPDP